MSHSPQESTDAQDEPREAPEAAPEPAQAQPVWRTWLWRGVGYTLLAIGIVGLALPIYPTVPFLILAAMAFAHGDPAARRKLLAHPRVGPPLQAWFDHGIVSRKAKVFAIVSMFVGASVGIWTAGMGLPLASVVVCVIVSVAVWLALRPEHPPRSAAD